MRYEHFSSSVSCNTVISYRALVIVQNPDLHSDHINRSGRGLRSRCFGGFGSRLWFGRSRRQFACRRSSSYCRAALPGSFPLLALRPVLSRLRFGLGISSCLTCQELLLFGELY